MNITENEKRDIIKYLEKGKPLLRGGTESAVKVIDIFGNDTTKVAEVNI